MFFIDKKTPELVNISLKSSNFFENENELIKFQINLKSVLNENSILFYSSKIYFGEEFKLDIDNAQLILPRDCIKDKKVISIKQFVKNEKLESGLKIYNLIECELQGQEFDKPLKLKMQSPVTNPKPYKSTEKWKDIKHDIYEQEIKHFCKRGIQYDTKEKDKR